MTDHDELLRWVDREIGFFYLVQAHGIIADAIFRHPARNHRMATSGFKSLPATLAAFNKRLEIEAEALLKRANSAQDRALVAMKLSHNAVGKNEATIQEIEEFAAGMEDAFGPNGPEIDDGPTSAEGSAEPSGDTPAAGDTRASGFSALHPSQRRQTFGTPA